MNASQTQFDAAKIAADFPILNQRIYRERRLVYLDNGASTQRPQVVIDAMTGVYEKTYANVHRGIHWLSEQASAQYEQSRIAVQKFIGAGHTSEVIFTGGTTLGINTVAQSWGQQNISAGDEILLTIMEHHSNIVPWQQLAARTGATVRFVGLTADQELDLEDLQSKLSEKTKLVAVTAVSNVLGNRNPVKKIVEMAKSVGAVTLVDAAQHVPHEPTNVGEWGADFVVFSGHKMLGPSGIGVLYGRRELLEAMPPFLGGGSMIGRVTTDGFTDGELPAKFEAGTPPIAQAIGLGAAIEYLNQFDLEEIGRHEIELNVRCREAFAEIPGLTVLGSKNRDIQSGIVSFSVDGASPQDISILLDQQGVAVRAGHHCAMPLHDELKLRSSCRASFYLYNTNDDVDALSEALKSTLAKLI